MEILHNKKKIKSKRKKKKKNKPKNKIRNTSSYLEMYRRTSLNIPTHSGHQFSKINKSIRTSKCQIEFKALNCYSDYLLLKGCVNFTEFSFILYKQRYLESVCVYIYMYIKISFI